MGTKGSPSGGRIANNCEYIVVWARDIVQKRPEITDKPEGDLIDLTQEEQSKFLQQLWMIKPESRAKSGHRCAFPEELVRRLIKLYTFLGDTVCDPFSGSGISCCMAARMGRKFVGFDNSKQDVKKSQTRLEEALKNPLPVAEVPDWEFAREKRRARNNELFKAMRLKESGHRARKRKDAA